MTWPWAIIVCSFIWTLGICVAVDIHTKGER